MTQAEYIAALREALADCVNRLRWEGVTDTDDLLALVMIEPEDETAQVAYGRSYSDAVRDERTPTPKFVQVTGRSPNLIRDRITDIDQ